MDKAALARAAIQSTASANFCHAEFTTRHAELDSASMNTASSRTWNDSRASTFWPAAGTERFTSARHPTCLADCISTGPRQCQGSQAVTASPRLVYYELADTMEAAILREKQLKAWKRDWKIALVEQGNPFWEDLAIGLGFEPMPQA